jgi:hypothetical protein
MSAVRSRRVSQPPRIVQKVGGSFLAVASAGFGILFLVLLTGSESFSSLFWSRTPCEMLRAELPAQPVEGEIEKPGSVQVLFRYRWKGEEYTSDRLHISGSKEFSGNEAAIWLTRYKPGTETVCWVNPKHPAHAVLERESWGYLSILVVPLIFVAVGVVGIIRLWAPQRQRPASAREGVWVLRAFFGIFLLFGLGFLVPLVLLPAWMMLKALSWAAVPCVIEHSGLASFPGNKTTTYSVEVLYRYEFDGREYRSDRYDFFPGSSSGRESKAAAVRARPVGSQTTCFVDPEHPHEAVLHRGPSAMMWLGVLPGVFILVGAGGMALVGRAGNRQTPARKHSKTPSPQRQSQPPSAPAALRPSASPIGKVVGMLLVALFWNGLVSIFLGLAWSRWKAGEPEWFVAFFMIPFVLVGLAMIGGVGYYFLALFNPRVHLTLVGTGIFPGSPLQLQWRVGGAAERIRKLRIVLEGREEATYRRGTSTSTDRSVFAEIPLFESSDPRQISEGRAQAQLPADTMHSFASRNNRIVWTLKVHGSIPRFPDVSDDYPITVLPRAAA